MPYIFSELILSPFSFLQLASYVSHEMRKNYMLICELVVVLRSLQMHLFCVFSCQLVAERGSVGEGWGGRQSEGEGLYSETASDTNIRITISFSAKTTRERGNYRLWLGALHKFPFDANHKQFAHLRCRRTCCRNTEVNRYLFNIYILVICRVRAYANTMKPILSRSTE